MVLLENRDACTGCGACANVCPKKAIFLLPDERGFYYPQLDADKCIDCGLCKRVCLIGRKKELETPDFSVEVYAAYAKDDFIRRQSSSGGVFSILALEILRQGGIVYGAAFDENFNVTHIGVRTEEDLAKLRGSKYVQSFISDTLYREIKQELENGVSVLFSGTPCQVAGLKLFLQKSYSNLLLVDLICHGVPSPKVFSEYLKDLEKKYGKITSYKFRDKHRSWKWPNVEFYTSDDCHRIYYGLDSFINLFNKSTVRNSCYQCEFANSERISDLTIGDFWKYKSSETMPDDDRGMSCVLCNSAKGTKFFLELPKALFFEKRKLEEVEAGNPRLLSPREQVLNNFWPLFLTLGFHGIKKKFCSVSLRSRLGLWLRIGCPWLYNFLRNIWGIIKK